MSGEVVNLSRVRKAKARSERAVQAAANRTAFGRTNAQKQADAIEADRRERTLDGARRED